MTADARFDFDGEYGSRYDAIIGRVFPAYDAIFPILIGHLSRLVAPDGAILVVGAGTGAELIAFAEAEPGWRLTGVDPSAQMLETARRKLAAHHLADRVTLFHGYVHELPDTVFDAATATSVMHFLPDDAAKLRFLRSIAAHLRPRGALLLIDTAGEPGTAQFDEAMAAWMRYTRVMGLTEDDVRTYRERVRHDVTFLPESRILELLEEAGFGTVEPFFRALTFRGWIGRTA